MEALAKLDKARYIYIYNHLIKAIILSSYSADSAQAKVNFQGLDHAIIIRGITRKEIAAIKTRYMTTHQRCLALNEEVCRIEEILGIEQRWTADSPEYAAALKVVHE